MCFIKFIIIIGCILTINGCVSNSSSNKSSYTTIYSNSEDLSTYLPKDFIDTLVTERTTKNSTKIDSSLIITARLDSMLNLVNEYNKQQITNIAGLTIQLYSGNNRTKAKEVQIKAYQYFPNSEPEITFIQPNYKVRMAKFYSQLEAYPVFKAVQVEFSKAILVPTKILISNK